MVCPAVVNKVFQIFNASHFIEQKCEFVGSLVLTFFI